MIDKLYCASSYLTFRFIKDENVNFYQGLNHKVFKPLQACFLQPCKNHTDIGANIQKIINRECISKKTAILLSGGIDSAIIASYLPKGTIAYTFQCIAHGAIDETAQARKYCDLYELEHRIIPMEWSDFENLTPSILKFNGVPVHSIEIQLYKAAQVARKDGIEKLFIGESADLIFGGMDKLLSKDWTFEEWIDRYTFVNPSKVLVNPSCMRHLYEEYRTGDKIDLLRFMDEIFSIESSSSYMHAFAMAGIDYVDPYAALVMSEKLDLERVRNGEPKYLLRELFAERYPTLDIPNKIPMPRAMDQWLSAWEGPKRDEFLVNCASGLTGDQKWLLYCLEVYFNLNEGERQ